MFSQCLLVYIITVIVVLVFTSLWIALLVEAFSGQDVSLGPILITFTLIKGIAILLSFVLIICGAVRIIQIHLEDKKIAAGDASSYELGEL